MLIYQKALLGTLMDHERKLSKSDGAGQSPLLRPRSMLEYDELFTAPRTRVCQCRGLLPAGLPIPASGANQGSGCDASRRKRSLDHQRSLPPYQRKWSLEFSRIPDPKWRSCGVSFPWTATPVLPGCPDPYAGRNWRVNLPSKHWFVSCKCLYALDFIMDASPTFSKSTTSDRQRVRELGSGKRIRKTDP